LLLNEIVALTRTYSLINPAATQRQVEALTAQLLTITTTKAGPAPEPRSTSAHLDMRQQADARRAYPQGPR